MDLNRWLGRSLFFVLILTAVGFAQQAPARDVKPDVKKGDSASSSTAPSAQGPAASAPAHPGGDINPQPNIPGLDPKTGVPIYETIQEDWASLQIGTSKLEPETPISAPPEEHEKFTRTLVQLKWRPGDLIDVWVSIPKGVKNPPVVLYLYNYSEDTDRFRSDAWCERVTSDGVAAVGFVSALSGHRFHDRPMKQWFVSELQESLGSTVHDVKFILDYLASRGDLDMSRVGMFGQGSGGAIAVLAAAADPRIKAIDLLEPWGDWPEFLAKSTVPPLDPGYERDHDQYTSPAFLKRVEPLDPVKWLPQLLIPIRIQQVRNDDTVPMEAKERLKEAAPKQAQVARFETNITMYRTESGGTLFGWVKDRLKELSQPHGEKALSVAQRDSPSSGKVSQPAPQR